MKKFNIIILLSLFFAFTACENDEERMYINPTDQVTSPVLSLTGLADITINAENIALVPAVLNWTRSDFGQEVLVSYSLQIADNKEFGGKPLVIALGNNLYTRTLTNQQLSDWVINSFNGLDNNGNPVRRDLFMRISATPTLENPTAVTLPPDILYSNVVELSVLPYYIPPAVPEEIFMIGADFGNWDWNSDGVVVMTPVHSHPGCFWAVRYLTAANGFKWNTKRAWNGSEFFSLGEDIGFTTVDGNAFVATDGLYMIFIDAANNRISVETPKVYGMGDCFGGWDTGKYPFAIEGRTMTITTANSGEVRMYAASDIAPNGGDWWQMEFVPIGGVIQYRGTGPDQERIVVDAGKKVTLDFNAGTGIIQ